MTKEEIVDGLELYTVGRLKKSQVYITVEELQKYIDEIKALEQEPCEDAVSRQAVLNEVRAIATWHSGDAFNEDRVIRHMKMLPSVNLTRAHGEWILINPLQENDGGAYVCSKCHHGDYGCETYNFCFNCGADMRGAEDAK